MRYAQFIGARRRDTDVGVRTAHPAFLN